MTVVDASVWVSRFVALDVHHTTSERWLHQQLSLGRLIAAPTLLLAEVAGAIARRSGQPVLAEQAVRDLLALPMLRLVPVDPRLGLAAARLAADLQLRGSDAVYVAIAESLRLPLVTWDRQQQQRAAAVVATQTPGPIHP